MTEEENKNLKNLLTSEMVSRVTLAEAINIMHNLAVQEVEVNVDNMSDEEKAATFKELTAKVEAAKAENSEEKSEELV
tara:strand:+ start:24567 stop:24800 length:234 start_codon:yes stop_codon:yes gene_type:complete